MQLFKLNNQHMQQKLGTCQAMTQLILYTTSHCHLCEQAETILTSIKKEYSINWHSIEISNDDHLTDLYGTRIPVIKCIDTQAEINWPFCADDILKLIKP